MFCKTGLRRITDRQQIDEKNSQCFSPSWKCYQSYGELPFPPSYDYHQELKQQTWTRICRKRNPYMLMVGMLPQKSKNRITSCTTSGSITKRIQVSMPQRKLDKLVYFHATTPMLQTHRLSSPDGHPSSLALYSLQENGNENYHSE